VLIRNFTGDSQPPMNWRRLPEATDKAAYARVEEHSMLLLHKAVYNPRPSSIHPPELVDHWGVSQLDHA
jgi:hypothetical protein